MVSWKLNEKPISRLENTRQVGPTTSRTDGGQSEVCHESRTVYGEEHDVYMGGMDKGRVRGKKRKPIVESVVKEFLLTERTFQ